MSPRIRARYGALGFRSMVGAPIVNDGRLVTTLLVGDTAQREWSDDAVMLVRDVADRTWTALARARAAEALRASAERQAFLLKLSDALRPLDDPVAVQTAAMEVLGAHMQVNRAFYGDAENDQDTLVIGPGYSRDTFPLEGVVRFSEFDLDMATWYRAGRTYVIEDTEQDTRFDASTKTSFRTIAVRAAVGVPLVKEGRVRAIVSLHQTTPRRWTDREIALLEDTAERTWAAVERARAEVALQEAHATLEQRVVERTADLAATLGQLRESEERLRTLVQASSEVLYRMSPDWTEMQELRGGGFPADTAHASATWLEHYIHPDDQPHVMAAIQEAIRTKGTFALEHRVRRADGSLGWTFSRAVPRLRADGEITEWFGAASDVTAHREAEEALRVALAEQQALLREVNHRVKNNLAVLDSLLSLQAAEVDTAGGTAGAHCGQPHPHHRRRPPAALRGAEPRAG